MKTPAHDNETSTGRVMRELHEALASHSLNERVTCRSVALVYHASAPDKPWCAVVSLPSILMSDKPFTFYEHGATEQEALCALIATIRRSADERAAVANADRVAVASVKV